MANPLGTERIGKLLFRFAIPSIISMLVNSLYNIVDQIFIGRGIGMLGNAATNVAFPITTITLAIALLLGIGTTSNFNLRLGAGEEQKAGEVVGTGILLVFGSSVVLCLLMEIFLYPVVRLCGASGDVLSYAVTYTRIIVLGIPLSMISTAGSHMVRGDGRPLKSMTCVVIGAVINTVLDPLFIFVFQWGMAGAAIATVMGQAVSGCLMIWYLFHYQSIRMKKEYFRVHISCLRDIASLGAAACFNQMAITLVQIVMNNVLTYYGARSVYGSEIPLACVGIIMKVNSLLIAVVVGISQGCQPIFGFNYGAKQYERVKTTLKLGLTAVTVISLAAFLSFQIFPRQIIQIFGGGSELYYQFAIRYFRIYMLLTLANGLQPLTSNFFTSIGKAKKGIFISMTRQVIFLLPLIIIFPMILGIDGVMYAGPIADTAALIVAGLLLRPEIKKMNQLTCREQCL
ncbi:MAG: MATE family efflux transporter [Lachnospiraceae bacterium]